MPRKGRECSTTEMYHVIIRGNDRQDIFLDNQDRYVFLNRLKDAKDKFYFYIYSYCLMNNHVHIVIKIKYEFLSKMMNVLENRYSQYFNKKTKRTGHLFENRFYSKKVEDEGYFMRLCKYVHRNPEKAGIEKTEKYQWSSFNDYIYKKDDFIERDTLLNCFDDSLEKLKEYTLDNDDTKECFYFAEFEIRNKLNDEEFCDILKFKYGFKNGIDISLIEENEKIKIINELKKIEGTSFAQISRVTRVTPYWIKQYWKE